MQPHSLEHAQEASVMAVKAAPPVAVVGATLFGVPLQEWVYILTIIYLVLQIVSLLLKCWKERRS